MDPSGLCSRPQQNLTAPGFGSYPPISEKAARNQLEWRKAPAFWKVDVGRRIFPRSIWTPLGIFQSLQVHNYFELLPWSWAVCSNRHPNLIFGKQRNSRGTGRSSGRKKHGSISTCSTPFPPVVAGPRRSQIGKPSDYIPRNRAPVRLLRCRSR